MRAVAKIVIYDADGHVLKLVRSETHPVYPHEIDMPGGFVEHGETPEFAVIRETLEETGLCIAVHNLTHVKRQLAYWGAIEHLFTASLESVKPAVSLSWEHEAWAWEERDDVLFYAVSDE